MQTKHLTLPLPRAFSPQTSRCNFFHFCVAVASPLKSLPSAFFLHFKLQWPCILSDSSPWGRSHLQKRLNHFSFLHLMPCAKVIAPSYWFVWTQDKVNLVACLGISWINQQRGFKLSFCQSNIQVRTRISVEDNLREFWFFGSFVFKMLCIYSFSLILRLHWCSRLFRDWIKFSPQATHVSHQCFIHLTCSVAP